MCNCSIEPLQRHSWERFGLSVDSPDVNVSTGLQRRGGFCDQLQFLRVMPVSARTSSHPCPVGDSNRPEWHSSQYRWGWSSRMGHRRNDIPNGSQNTGAVARRQTARLAAGRKRGKLPPPKMVATGRRVLRPDEAVRYRSPKQNWLWCRSAASAAIWPLWPSKRQGLAPRSLAARCTAFTISFSESCPSNNVAGQPMLFPEPADHLAELLCGPCLDRHIGSAGRATATKRAGSKAASRRNAAASRPAASGMVSSGRSCPTSRPVRWRANRRFLSHSEKSTRRERNHDKSRRTDGAARGLRTMRLMASSW